MTKQIPLTQGQVALVDDEDFERVSQFKWRIHYGKSGKKYANGWVRIDGKLKTVLMHRFILNVPAGKEVDHRNGDSLDNTRSNIRICTLAQNKQNQRKRCDNTSGYKGVRRKLGDLKWRATIFVNGREKYLGAFGTAIEAALVYDEAARKFYGEFAKTNF